MTQDTTPPNPGAGDPVYRLIGQVTRQLHDALEQLGVMNSLQHAAEGLPDARQRLNFIADKSAAAADKVLTLVERAKAEHRAMAETMRAIESHVAARAGSGGDDRLAALIARFDACRADSDANLTEIMLAQDFHDLTGQVVVKVISLAAELEASLVRLLMRGAPAEPAAVPLPALQGPVVAASAGVVGSQHEVDELLASLGF